MDSSSLSAQQELLKRERAQFRAKITADDDDDVLAPYERYISWLTEQARASPHGPFDLELLTVFEEAVRSCKDDPEYKNDIRYVKLWLAYAQRVEKPDIIYVYLLKNEVGGKNAQLYEDYASSLEGQDRFREAEEAYKLGISRSKRGAERLKTRYREFKQRVQNKSTLKPSRKPPHIPSSESSSLGAKLYKNPLRNISGKRSQTSAPMVAADEVKASSSSSTPPSTSDSPVTRSADPYAYMKAAMNAPPAPGKKAEKYRFDMSLMLRDGQEFCIQEARAASLGLLGKKWGPPPLSELGPNQASDSKQTTVNLKDGGSKPATRTNLTRMNTNMTAQLADQPTVTLNTKEALRDVFGMYNSPERTMKTTSIALGSKHAPVRKLDPLLTSQPRNNLKKITEIGDEENDHPSKPAAFRPFVDDENRKENEAPVAPKFKPFVDENVDSKTPHVTPKPRKALAAKELPSETPISRRQGQQDDEPQSETEIATQESQTRNAFDRVFTPVNQGAKDRPVLQAKAWQERQPVFRDSQEQSNGQGGSILGSKVFSRPPEPRPLSQIQRPVVQPQENSLHRSNSAPQRSAFAPVSRERQPQPFRPQRTPQRPVEPEPEPEPEPLEQQQVEEIEEYGEDFEPELPLEENAQEEGEYYDDEDPNNLPMGGRLGRFDVMTPIAERTFECTMTTRTILSTPSKSNGNMLDEGLLHNRDPALAAEKLAQELWEEEARLRERDRDVDMEDVVDNNDEESGFSDAEESEQEDDDLVERTGTLSLADAIAVASSFKPPNPCNPSDPHILNTLLSLIPPEPDFHDLRTEVSGQFDSLQKFASRYSCRGSGRSSRSSDGEDSHRVQLRGQSFKVSDKLGEGGFGAVFKAKAVQRSAEDEDEEMNSDEDSDDEDANLFALKVVKPRNIWEFHILRRLHSVLPIPIRQSIVIAHALYAYRDESFLVLELCNQGTLLDVVNHAAEAGVVQQGACLDELLVIFFAIELLKFVESMHKAGFIHGDLKIDNCLLRLEDVPGGTNAWSGMYQSTGEGGWKYKGIKMIDFGRTIDTRMYPAGHRFVADWKTDVHDCFEMRENRPWTYETDYFGLAGILYCLLFGKYFDAETVVEAPSTDPVRHKLAAQFKRYWQSDLWSRLFDLLLNPTLARPDRSLPLVSELASLREEMETWLSSNCNRSTNTLKGLLKKIERSVLSASR